MCGRLTPRAQWPWAVTHLYHWRRSATCVRDAAAMAMPICCAYTCYDYIYYGVPGRRNAGALSANSRRIGGRSTASLCGVRTRERNAKPSGSSLASTPWSGLGSELGLGLG